MSESRLEVGGQLWDTANVCIAALRNAYGRICSWDSDYT